MLPASQKQLLQSNVGAGVHVLHVVAVDKAGRLTKAAGHYRVNIGTDPGVGTVTGTVTGANAAGASVTINRGLYNTTVSGTSFNFPEDITAGTWELTVTAGAQTVTKTITVNPGAQTVVPVALP
jgi:hypothetical protein